VWSGERKIASIGVHVARGVATHGFAVNVQNDLQPFAWVVPCGLEGVQMTSVLRETAGSGELLTCFRRRMAHRLAEALGRRQRLVSRARLEAAMAAAPAAAPPRSVRPVLRHCPICGRRALRFARTYAGSRDRGVCPRCGSRQRHRHLWLYLERRTDLLRRPQRLLHFAPEPGLRACLRAHTPAWTTSAPTS
jgi:hypothetical protein